MKAQFFDSSFLPSPRDALEFIGDLLESSTEYAIIGHDREGRIVLWNEGASRLYGYSPEETVGRVTGAILYPPEDREAGRPQQLMDTALRTGRWSGILTSFHRSGERFDARAVLTPIHDAAGGTSGFLLIARDVSAEKSGRRKGEDKFRGLLEAAPDAMVIVDREGRIAIVNSQTEKLFGYPRDELLGKPIETLLPERFRAKHPDRRSGYFREPHVRSMADGREVYGRRKDESEFPVEISLGPLETEEGLMVSSSIRDITERKREERALQERHAKLERASLAKDQFLTNISQELRALLMNLPAPLTVDQDERLRTFQTSARHLLSLIDDILAARGPGESDPV